jgi:hypothetical protein
MTRPFRFRVWEVYGSPASTWAPIGRPHWIRWVAVREARRERRRLDGLGLAPELAGAFRYEVLAR